MSNQVNIGLADGASVYGQVVPKPGIIDDIMEIQTNTLSNLSRLRQVMENLENRLIGISPPQATSCAPSLAPPTVPATTNLKHVRSRMGTIEDRTAQLADRLDEILKQL